MYKHDKNSILIVDDETANHIFLTHLLGADYVLYTAKDGRDAIRKAMTVLPDLILLDIVMPDMDGYEVLAKLKNSPETHHIPVVFTTGLDSSEDEIKGLASDAADYISKPFIPEVVRLRVRNQINIVNHTRTIKLMSTTDQLTGIANRRGFDEAVSREWPRNIREKLPLSILMADVDNFKIYNETYGHPQGDAVLQLIAQILRGAAGRSVDYAARWGGEEYIVLLPNTHAQGAMDVAERIRAGIEKTPVYLPNGEPTYVTVSIGVNTVMPVNGDYIGKLIEGADLALNAAKNAGRNRVCFYESTSTNK
jgi:diguanylate cyclase (GGDEF)-like protein